jgi:RHS repeat-associated protein
MRAGSARYCYHFNPAGSTAALTDMSGSVVNSYSYDPFGVPAGNETVPQPFMFDGRYGVMFEPEDLYYMRARYYDPNVGRFISEDPLGFAGGDVNLHAYVQNDPLNTIDPFGLTAMELAAPIALVISQLDSPAPGPADMIAGALIGAAWIYDTWPKDNSCGTMMGKIGDDDKVRDILKARKGSIKQAQLPEGSPSWDTTVRLNPSICA